MNSENKSFNELLGMLPEGWEANANELGAFRRAREIQTPEELLRLILLYLTEGKSFAGTSALAHVSSGVELSKVALFKRIRNSAGWLKWLCETIYRRSGILEKKPEWLKGRTVKIVDGSENVLCGVRRKCYMLYYCLNLFTLDTEEFLITDMKTGEKLVNFENFRKGDIIMGDRIYGNLKGIAYMRKKEADYVLRINRRGFHLVNGKNQPIDLKKRLSRLKEGTTTDISGICMIDGAYVPIRMCAYRKDAQRETEGLTRIKKTNQRKHGGKAVTEEQRENNKYILVATSLGKEITASQVLELYRARWQIELAFKRLKSLFHYNDVPARQSESAKAWFYGKFLLAALCETVVNSGRFSPSSQAEP
jgi:hypothetical protein